MRRLGSTAASLALVFAQIVLLSWVGYEASFPTCASHDSCPTGGFCYVPDVPGIWRYAWNTPRCSDCHAMLLRYAHKVNATRCAELEGARFVQDVLLSPWAAERKPWDSLDHTQFFYRENRLRDELVDEYMCGARFHCEETDAWPEKCDFLHIHLANLSWPRVLLLLLVSLLLAMPLASDIEQSATEYAPKEHTKETSSREHACATPRSASPRCIGTGQDACALRGALTCLDVAEHARREALLDYGIKLGIKEGLLHDLLRLGLRIRRRVLPCVTVTASVAIIVMSPIDASNILLNLLGIAFLLESDEVCVCVALHDP
jgi:hypothetical protein